MCLHKYDLSGKNVLQTIMCVNWLKKNVNCSNLRKSHWIVATLFLLCRDIVSLCRNEDWISLLEVAVNYVATYLFMLRHYLI